MIYKVKCFQFNIQLLLSVAPLYSSPKDLLMARVILAYP